MSDLYLALVHHPIVNKEGRIVTTSVTNFDLHDLARNGRTFNVKKVFILTPSEVQRNMVTYIQNYWQEGVGATYNPDRKQAFEIIAPTANLEETCLTIKTLSGTRPLLISTTAKKCDKSVSYSFIRELLKGDRPLLIAFGTGFGLAQDFLDQSDFVLEPIEGVGDYNHLPVRSAVAIILDRLVNRA